MQLDSRISQMWRKPSVRARGTRDSIVIVDDDQAGADALALLLNLRGFNVTVSYDAFSAVDVVDLERPDLVVLDVSVPVSEGFALAAALRASGAGHDIAIVAYSALEASLLRSTVGWEHFNAYCQKGAPPKYLLELLEAILV